MIKERLQQPVGRFMRPCVTIEDFASIHLAIENMREAGLELIPVTRDGKLVGALTQSGILKIVAEDASPDTPVRQYVDSVPSISNRVTGAEALRKLEANPTLIVVDDHEVVCGLLTASCFVGTVSTPERPHMIGGMATPFGVYLTTGSVRGGRKDWYLVATGLFLMFFFGLGQSALDFAVRAIPNQTVAAIIGPPLTALAMLCLFRLLPIAGYHAAEHMVVHALERDESLTPEVVARMPRVHPRCGTNLAVAITMFSVIAFEPWSNQPELQLAIAVLVTLFLWRSVGSFVQYWFTTRKPTAKQIQSGIDAGTELLANYATSRNRVATPLTRIYCSGMLHVMTGSFLALGIGWLISKVFGIEFLLR